GRTVRTVVAAARVGRDGGAVPAEQLVEREPGRLRLDVPERDVDAGDRGHQLRLAARAEVRLPVRGPEARGGAAEGQAKECIPQPLVVEGILSDQQRLERRLEDARDLALRAPVDLADPDEAVVGLDLDDDL